MKVSYLSCRVFYKKMPSANLYFRRHFLFLSNTISVWLDCFQTA